MIKSWKAHMKSLEDDDSEIAEAVKNDLETARLLAQEMFGKGWDRKPALVLEIFKELSDRRRDD